jgi:uncharacterized protein YkwD
MLLFTRLSRFARRPSRQARPGSQVATLAATLVLTVLSLAGSAQAQESETAAPPTSDGAGSLALERINRYRTAAGVPDMAAHPALMESAAGHVRYYEANRGAESLVGMGLHEQTQDAPGFTGVSMGDRAKAAGYRDGAVTENAGFGQLDTAIDWYMDTVNHRLPLIHPSALDVGLAQSAEAGFGIIAVGLRGDQLDIDLPSVYPPSGATDVQTTWDGSETPDPAPGIARPLGYPITAAFGRFQKVEWIAAELRDASGALLEVSTPRTDWMRAIAIIPHRPLASGETYTARVEALVDGATVTKEWTFTARS